MEDSHNVLFKKDNVFFFKLKNDLNFLEKGRQSQKNTIKNKNKTMVVAPLRVT